jgi:hypothetical protein
VVLLLAASAAQPQMPYDLTAAVARYDRAQLEGNRGALEQSLADEYLLVNSSGKTETKAQLVADYTAPGFHLKSLIIEDPVEKLWDGGAVMGGVATLSGTDGGKPFSIRLRYADVWAKRNGQWQVVYTHAEHASANPSEPHVRLGDVASLSSVISFGAPDPFLHFDKGGELWWRVDVDLQPKTALKNVRVFGYAPVDLQLNDGRCFQVGFEGKQPQMDEVSLRPTDCREAGPIRAPASPPPQPGAQFLGKSWDLDAWEEHNGKTVLVQSRNGHARTVLTTSMKVLAFGALGSPDTPMTEVTLAGYVGKQLTLATVMLFIP